MSRTKALIKRNSTTKENRCHTPLSCSKFENEREHFQRRGEPVEMWRLVASFYLFWLASINETQGSCNVFNRGVNSWLAEEQYSPHPWYTCTDISVPLYMCCNYSLIVFVNVVFLFSFLVFFSTFNFLWISILLWTVSAVHLVPVHHCMLQHQCSDKVFFYMELII